MDVPNTPRSPSPCSMSSLAGEFEETVSCPSTEDDNFSRSAFSEPRTLVALRNESRESCSDGPEKKRHTKARKQKAIFEGGSDPLEEPKLIWTKSRKRALRYFLFIHFVPVAITVVLFWLYLEGFQWRANDVQLKTLLFAAKIHESLILISLADILFHRIRYQLLTGRGISFGLLVSPFRVSSPFSLLQTPFLASAKFTLKSGPELVTILLVLLVSVLALLASPSSGVLMLPRYDWWPIPNDDPVMKDFTKQDYGTAGYLGASFDDLFPALIDNSFARNFVIDDDSETHTLSNRFEQLISGLDRVLVDGSLRGNANITVVEGATVDAFGLAYQEETLEGCDLHTCHYFSQTQNQTIENIIANPANPDHDCPNIICQSLAIQSTSPLALVTQKLFDRYRNWMPSSSSIRMITAEALDGSEGARTWRQPSVSMQCSTVRHDGQEEILFQHFGAFKPFSITPDSQLVGLIEDLKSRRGQPAIYTDIARLIPPEISISTAILMQGDTEAKTANNATYLCLVDARWIESEVWFTSPYASVMRSGVSLESVQAVTGSNDTSGANPVIKITSEYTKSLDTHLKLASIYISKETPTERVTPFEFIQRYCHMRVMDGLQPRCAMLAHALYLTDSLRRTPSTFGYLTEASSAGWESVGTDKQTKLGYRVSHQLHAYKFEGSIIKLSMSVLLVHMMLVYAHLLLLLLGDGWCSRAWSELGELMALAILTRPTTLLQNAGGGVDNWKTWRLRTFVREVTPEGRLELILKETGETPRVLLQDDEGREKTLIEPEADRKYG